MPQKQKPYTKIEALQLLNNSNFLNKVETHITENVLERFHVRSTNDKNFEATLRLRLKEDIPKTLSILKKRIVGEYLRRYRDKSIPHYPQTFKSTVATKVTEVIIKKYTNSPSDGQGGIY